MRLSVKDTARLMECTEQMVRIGLQRGIFDFGVAIKMNGNRYTYHISKSKVLDYLGN